MRGIRLLQQTFRRCFCRGGHGVHSPFAFTLLTRVVEERACYTAYENILDTPSWVASRKKTIKEREALLLYRIMAHYPIVDILYKGEEPLFQRLLGLLEPVTENTLREHAYGPYSEQELFHLVIVDKVTDLFSERVLSEEPTILYVSMARDNWAKQCSKRFYANMSHGIEVDLLYGKLFVLTPNLFKNRYKSLL
ncbi:hypothetical protein [Porphyromonas circumdentaria]|uniref:Uncharacterized protein n=1 Tax=Porphyromonas circumdentaria TaxID=29524 RepID=A0A1T4MXQ8_9PORP|nr:hypothetical protein [Porphyromonas circumdentaria]MBB6275968.1 hypothetical protein [Porphyromonas circumdentaria]SJZ71577.1 hypothetical protein SAMN02745171_00930 [Porphyromonas circumdentaria]